MQNSPAAQPTYHTDSPGLDKTEIDISLVCNPKTNKNQGEKLLEKLQMLDRLFKSSPSPIRDIQKGNSSFKKLKTATENKSVKVRSN